MLKTKIQLFAEGEGEGNAAGMDFETEFNKQFPGFAAPEKAEKPEAKQAPKEKQVAAAQESTEQETPEDRDAAFEKLIKGEFKNEYQKRFQAGLNERFRKNNERISAAEKELADYKEALSAYAQKLGVDVNDVKALGEAVLNDKNNFRSIAVERGITIEEAVQEFKSERENAKKEAEIKAQTEAENQRKQNEQLFAERRAVYDAWKQDEAQIRQSDPGFSLSEEIANNDEFRKALGAGMSVSFAYKATHFDRKMADIAGAVERQTAINTAQRIASNQKRPPEGGLSPNAANKNNVDYKNLPENEFMAIFNESLKH